jgi:hypothetical protein
VCREGRNGSLLLCARPDRLAPIPAVFRSQHQLLPGAVEIALGPAIVRAALQAQQLLRGKIGTRGCRWSVVAFCRGSIACLVAAMKDWLAGASITEGPVFRPVGKGGRVVPSRLTPQRLIVKAYAVPCGSIPTHSQDTASAPASCRRASLFKKREPAQVISVDTLRGYVRDADAFQDHAGAGLL